jgi:tetratricopeptide (TPR) repeat protein
MSSHEPKWNGEDWLARCAWCARVIPENQEVFALNVKDQLEAARRLEPGKVHPLLLQGMNKTIPLIIPGMDSAARREGVSAVFQVCCKKCGLALQEALRQELRIGQTELTRPGQPTGPPPATRTFPPLPPAMAPLPPPSMERMMRYVTKLIEEKHFETPEEVNSFLDSLGSLPGSGLDLGLATPLEQAQDMVSAAWEQPSRKKRRKLAKRALEISSDCADAYMLLAQDAEKPETAKELYEQAVAAAERALGPDLLRKAVGHFWGLVETRPYMRARAALAECLWENGEKDAAIDHFHDLLRLNPNDNQGLRYILADWLLEEGREEDVDQLLKRFPEDIAAAWQYDRALHLFRKEGPGKAAHKALQVALKRNTFVPDFLLGDRTLPDYQPESIGIGDEDEAVDYACRAVQNWQNTPYALDWLRENAGVT